MFDVNNIYNSSHQRDHVCDLNPETAVHDFKLQTAYLSCNDCTVALEAAQPWFGNEEADVQTWEPWAFERFCHCSPSLSVRASGDVISEDRGTSVHYNCL